MSGPVVAVAHTPAGMSDAQAEQAQLDIAHAVEAKDPDNVKTVVPSDKLMITPCRFPGDPQTWA